MTDCAGFPASSSCAFDPGHQLSSASVVSGGTGRIWRPRIFCDFWISHNDPSHEGKSRGGRDITAEVLYTAYPQDFSGSIFLYRSRGALERFRSGSALSHDLAFALSYLMDYHSNCAWICGHWSLTVEEQFYLLWPPLVVVLGFEKSFIAAVAFLFLAPFGRNAMNWLVPVWTATIGLLRGPQAVVGCIVAMSWKRMRARKTLFCIQLLFDFVIACVNAAALFLENSQPLPCATASYEPAYFIGLWIFHCVETPENMIAKILNSRLLSAIRVSSYSLYVWQEMFLVRLP